jgi:SAM-dependent methyltransferase
MATEASKTKAIWSHEVLSLLRGSGIDIGCGPDPILPHVDRFDREHGDANEITRHVTKRYDFVFSSHTLEHMRDPYAALREWFALVKPGGHLIVLVPDEDLYEQGAFPSVFNDDHRFTFTLSKQKSWSPRSVNVLELVRSVPGELVSATLQDHGYDRSLLSFAPGPWARRLGRIARKLSALFPARERAVARWLRRFGAAIDQSSFREPRLGQIQFILRKPE